MLGGNPAQGSSPATSLLYAGEQFDTDMQMYYNRARYYDQNTGRFNRMDPFAGSPQDPQSLHKYLYCHNNPVNNIDPSGRGIGAVITGVISYLVSIWPILRPGLIAVLCIGAYYLFNYLFGEPEPPITLRDLVFTPDEFVELVNKMQKGTPRITFVVDNYESNNWPEWFDNCVDAEVYTIGIYGYGAVGEDLTSGQENIVDYFEDRDWFDENPGIYNLFPKRTGEGSYKLKQGYAEMVRMNAAIDECRAFAREQGYLSEIDHWDAPDPWEEIYGGL